MPEPASDYARILDLIVQVEGFVTSLQARTHDAEAARDEAQKALAAAQADLEKAQSDLVLTAEQVAELEKRLEALSAPNGGGSPPSPMPPNPPPPQSDLPEHLRHLGPLPTLAQLDALSPDYANQVRLYFDATDPIQGLSQADKWARYKYSYDHIGVESDPSTEANDYYDRGSLLFAWEHILGGRPQMRQYGMALIDNYLAWISGQGFGPIANWVFTDGLRAAWVLTGDEKYRTAVGRLSDYFAVPYYMDHLVKMEDEMDSREVAYLIRAYQASAEINAPSLGTPGRVNGGNDWAKLLRRAVTDAIASQAQDGSRRRTFTNANFPVASGNKPFMEGLLNNALIDAYDFFKTSDPALAARIVDSVARSVDYLCKKNWKHDPEPSPYNPSLKLYDAFVYQEGEGGFDTRPYPAPDLNFIIIPAIAWAALMTGDKQHIAKGDAAFLSTCALGSWQYDKQLNELLGGYTYAAWRAQLAA
jgi:hypothetical protein